MSGSEPTPEAEPEPTVHDMDEGEDHGEAEGGVQLDPFTAFIYELLGFESENSPVPGNEVKKVKGFASTNSSAFRTMVEGVRGQTSKTRDGQTPKIIQNLISPWMVALQRPFLSRTQAEHLRVGVLQLDIIEAGDLPAADLSGYSDPYVVSTLTGYWSHGQEWPESMRTTQVTKVMNQTLRPLWNELELFAVPRDGAVIRLEVYDQDDHKTDDLLGKIEIPIDELLGGRTIDAWFKVKLAKPFAKALAKQIKKQKMKEQKAVVAANNRNLRRSLMTTKSDDSMGADSAPSDLERSASLSPSASESARNINRSSSLPPDIATEDSKKFKSEWAALKTKTRAVNALSKPRRKSVQFCKGRSARLHLRMRYHYSLFNVLHSLSWKEKEYEYQPQPFQLDVLVTEIFKVLVLIQPYIDFFTNEDLTGILDLWGWEKPFRSICHAVLFGWLCKNPRFLWPFIQLLLVNMSMRSYFRRVHLLANRKHAAAVGGDSFINPSTGKEMAEDDSVFEHDVVLPDDEQHGANWLPEDTYEECKWVLSGYKGNAIKNVCNMLRAEWLDTTMNIVIRINETLDNLKGFFDWRETTPCMITAVILLASAFGNLFLPFNEFLFWLNAFLFLFWTWIYDMLIRFIVWPFSAFAKWRKIRELQKSPLPVPSKQLRGLMAKDQEPEPR